MRKKVIVKSKSNLKSSILNSKTQKQRLLTYAKKHWFFSTLIFLVLLWCVYALFTPPSNNRNWNAEYAIQSTAVVNGDLITIINIRNQTYNQSGPTSLSYYNQTFNTSELSKLYFYLVSLSDSNKGVAHTFFEFEFVNGSSLTLSVEARREVGEEYSVWVGMLRSYEVFYVWSPVTDSVARRQVWQRPKMIEYQIRADALTIKSLFSELVVETNELQDHPRFYNTLFSTCTSNLFDAARKVSSKRLPWTISRFLPGYSTMYLYNLGLIETNLSLDVLEKNYLPVG